MSHAMSNDRDIIHNNRFPASFFLTRSEDENLSFLFDGPEMIRRSFKEAPKRRLVPVPAIAMVAVGFAILFGFGASLGGGSSKQVSQVYNLASQSNAD